MTLSSAPLDKVLKILDVCDGGHGLDELIALSTSMDGLVDDEVRRRACTFMTEHSTCSCLILYGRADPSGLSFGVAR